MIPLSEAQRLVWAAMRRLNVVAMDHREAVGLVLDEDVVASEDVPPFDNSAVDGYAVRCWSHHHCPEYLLFHHCRSAACPR